MDVGMRSVKVARGGEIEALDIQLQSLQRQWKCICNRVTAYHNTLHNSRILGTYSIAVMRMARLSEFEDKRSHSRPRISSLPPWIQGLRRASV